MTSGAASRERDGALIDGHTPMFARRSMAMCAVGERLVLFGGVGAAGTESILDVANDCWIFDTAALTWREVAPREPWPSARRCVGVAPTSTGLFLWGGSGVTREDGHTRYTFLNDWWHFDIDAHMWTERRESDDHRSAPSEETYPSPRYTPVFVRAEQQFLLFGGYTEDRLGHRKLNDAWIGDGRTWEPVPMQGVAGYERGAAWPGLRYGCMAAALGDCAFVFGGFSDDGDHNDLWQFSLSERRWQLVAPEASGPDVPPARYCAAFAQHDRRLFLFGGRSRRNPRLGFNDLWVFDLDRHRWECVHANREPHRYDAAAVYPGYHAKVAASTVGSHWFLWGGEGASGHVSDFWRFAFDTGRWQLLQAARPDDPTFW